MSLFDGTYPTPVKDTMGHRFAVMMLLFSMEPGAYDLSYSQFDTIRKLRSCVSNLWGTGTLSKVPNLSIKGDNKNKPARISSCPTDSEWFCKFALGCKKRMGQDVRPQLGFSIAVMIKLMSNLEQKWVGSSNEATQFLIAGIGAYAVLSYCASLRGNEGFLLDLHGLRIHINKGKNDPLHPHVTAPLLGRLKGEDGERYHMLLMASTTVCGLKPRLWLERLVFTREAKGLFKGPALCNERGELLSPSLVESSILDCLSEIQESDPETIGSDVQIGEVYGIFRSYRRGATTRAREANVSESDIDLINRWRKVERARGSRPGMAIRDHYLEVVQMISSKLRFSSAL